MKIVFDTNVLVSAFATHGSCSEVFEYCLSDHTICVSDWILEELYSCLTVKFKFSDKITQGILSFISQNSLKVKPKPLSRPICRDPGDDYILAAAIASKADCIISGDNDLLDLKSFQKIPIIKPSHFWQFEKDRLVP